MTGSLKAQAKRIDALSLRERIIMFVSIALAFVALADVFVLSPAAEERKRLSQQLRQQTAAIEKLQLQLDADRSAPSESPQGRQRAALQALRAKGVEMEAQIERQFSRATQVDELPRLLDQLLQRHERLTLSRLETSREDSTSPAVGSVGQVLSWQGVDLAVAGRYPDLVAYLSDLEATFPGLRWGALRIDAAASPPVLTVRLRLPGELR